MNKQNEFSREELLSCARGEMFGAGNAQLPMPGMLMVDRIIRITKKGGLYGKGQVIAEQDISPNLWFFHCHFLGDPIMPGSLCIEGMLQLLGFYLGWLGYPGRGRALGVGEVRFTGQIRPSSQKVTYQIDIKRVVDRKLNIGIADGKAFVDGREIYFAKDLRVCLVAEANDNDENRCSQLLKSNADRHLFATP